MSRTDAKIIHEVVMSTDAVLHLGTVNRLAGNEACESTLIAAALYLSKYHHQTFLLLASIWTE